MTDRTVKVSLIAQATGYIAGFTEAQKKTRELGSDVEKLAQKRQSFEQLGRAAIGFGTALAIGIGAAVAQYAQFDQAMSFVQAATHESAENMDLLRDAALEAGASTVFSATESANAVEELAKAGLSTSAVIGGALSGSLNLAAAGGLGVARAAEISAITLQQFKLRGSDAAHVADVLAAGAGKAMGSVDDLAQGLKFVGPVASAMGVSLEQTTGVLALFAQQGIIGEQAGTSLRGVLSSLTAPSAQARREIERLGLTLYDEQGNFLGLENAAGQLATAYRGMDDASRDASIGIIFGRETITAATALYEAGAEGVREWTTAVDDSGYAAETAAARLDNLKGDWEQFTGALETASIKAGEAADGPLRFLTQSATRLVDVFNDAPDGVQQTALAVAGVTAAVSLATGAFFLGVPKVAEYKAALADLGPAAQRAGRLATLAFKALAVAGTTATALVFVDQWLAGLKATSAELENTARTATSSRAALESSAKGLDVVWWGDVKLGAADVKDALESAAHSSVDFFAAMSQSNAQKGTLEAIKQYGEGLGTLARTDLPAAQGQFRKLTEEYKLSGTEQWRILSNMPGYKDALTEQANALGITADKQTLLKLAMGETAPAAAENAAALAEMQGAAVDTTGAVGELADAIRGFGSAELDSRAAAREFQEALVALDESVAANGTSLDITTEAGRQNEAALDGIASAALNSAAALAEQTGSEDVAAQAVANGRSELIKKLEQFGFTGQAAEDYADKLGLIPGNITTLLKVQNDEAMRKADETARKINSIPGYREIVINQVWRETGAPRGQVGAAYNANGGLYTYRAFANGGIAEGFYSGRAGGLYKFAEPETRWELFVSGRTGQEDRNRGLVWEAGRRLGMWQQAPAAYAQAPTSAAPTAAAPAAKSERHVHFHNPVTRDPLRDAQEAHDLIGADSDV